MDPHHAFAERLVFVHQSLLFALERLIATPDDALISLYVTFLDGHHDAEEHGLFPALRAAGRMRSTDVAFLDARESEHRDVARLTRALEREGIRHGAELHAVLASHLVIEEQGLTAARLREMIDASDIPTPRGDPAIVGRLFDHPLMRR
jgi:hypothetical protein